MKVLIIGGVAGGATAAARLRRLDEKAEIIIIERSGYVSYANCGLPYYIGGEITARASLTLQNPQSFLSRFQVEVRVLQEAVAIDRDTRTVTIRDLETQSEYRETYDKLILSPGATPRIPDIPGVENDGIFTLRTIEDTFSIYDYINQKHPKSAVIAGGGFIGLEMAENLKSKGVDVTILQRSGQVMPPLDNDMAEKVHKHLSANQIGLKLHASLQEITQKERKLLIQLGDGGAIQTEMIILAAGVVPESTLAKQAGLELGLKEAIRVNEHMQTSDPDIYAVGDAVEVRHFVSGREAVISLAGPANKQGRIAADHICGLESRFRGSQGSSILKLFDMTIAVTGLNMKAAKAAGYHCDYVLLTSSSHASYYPGAEEMTMKVVFEKPGGKILGGQIVGFGGVDKRIDVLATAIRANMTAYDLTELDLAYAPPYSSAKDPVNMAGYVIENLLTEKVKQIHWDGLETLPEQAVLLDARTDGEYARGSVPGAVHIPLDSLREQLPRLNKENPVYVFCQSGLRSYIACRILDQNGYQCYNIAGGYAFYNKNKK